MSERLGKWLADSGNPPLQIITGHMSAWDPVTGRNTVRFSGTQELTDLAYLGPAANLSTGRVLLLLTPGAPVILGRLTKPTSA